MPREKIQPNKPEMTKCTLKLPTDVWMASKHRAIDEGRDFQDIVADALRAYLKKGARR
jgi:hypothetical protein